MVSTRSNKASVDTDLPPTTTTTRQTRQSTRQSTRSTSPQPSPEVIIPPTTTKHTSTNVAKMSNKSIGSRSLSAWSHTPSHLTLLWLFISLPLVFWDTGYVLLRPHSMPGGWLHWPLWSPYELYGKVDYMYGKVAWDANNGFTASQGLLNLVESIMYLVYLGIVYRYGVESEVEGRGAVPGMGWLGKARRVDGRMAGWAVVVGFASCVMTWSKTVLYWLNEALSGFHYIGHNDVGSLFWLWIVPNGLWLIFPLFMAYVLAIDMIDAMEVASSAPLSSIKKTE